MRIASLVLAVASGVFAQLPHPDGGPVRAGTLRERWPTGGPRCLEAPDFQAHEYNADFVIIRQSGCSHYEKPFLYLLFGRDRALLLDTGAGQAPVARFVDGLIQKWLKRNQRATIHLVVAHTHEHSDHVAGDAQFQSWPQSEFVAPTLEAVQAHFGIRNWPEQIVTYDLGGRVLDVIPTPGHARTAVSFYDRQTGVLLTGDSLYPGRLYISDWAEFARSTKRLVDFTAGKVVTHVLGCHIENTRTPYLEYPIGSIYQPDEARLEMSRAHLVELHDVLTRHQGGPRRVAFRDFTLWPLSEADVREEMSLWRRRIETTQRARQWDQEAPRPAAAFVPKDFAVPTSWKSNGYQLVPLGPGLEKLDHDAYMGSIEHIRTRFGGGRWPYPGITMKEALDDVKGEKERFDARQSFTYAVLTADGQRERGCVYISPSRDARYEAQVRIWVTKADFDAGLEGQLWTEIRRWVNTAWPFERVRFLEPLE